MYSYYKKMPTLVPSKIEIEESDDFLAKYEIKNSILEEISSNNFTKLKTEYLENKFIENIAKFFFDYKIKTTSENIRDILGFNTEFISEKQSLPNKISTLFGGRKKTKTIRPNGFKSFKKVIASPEFFHDIDMAIKDKFIDINQESALFSVIKTDEDKIKDISNPEFVKNKLFKVIEKILKSREITK